MISNQILQNTIDGLKTIARVDFEVLDTEGKEVATTAEVPFGGRAEAAEFVKSQADSQEIQGCQFFKIYDDQQPEYVLVTIGSDENAYLVGKMAAFQIQNLMIAYKERFDKDNFVKNLLLDNLLLIDIYSRAKKLHIQTEVNRVAMIVETDNKDSNILEMLRSFLGVNSLDFITAVDERDVIVVKDLSEGDGVKEIEKAAKAMESFLKKEGMTGIRVAYGTVVKEIKEVSRSYKEAKMAMDVGKIFFDDRSIIAYSQLGIGRLIYQLPIPLCKMFIKEIFGDKSPDDLKKIEERLRSRFMWGLPVDIYPPDFNLRCEIIRSKVKNTSIENKLNDDVIEYIANSCVNDVRHIEGTINRLLAYTAMMVPDKITLDFANEALNDYVNTNIFINNSISSIQSAVAEYFKISVDDLKSKRRTNTVVKPRHIAMYLCRNVANMSLPQIGKDFGKRDHTTVMHACNKIEKDIKESKETKLIVESVKKILLSDN